MHVIVLAVLSYECESNESMENKCDAGRCIASRLEVANCPINLEFSWSDVEIGLKMVHGQLLF